MAFNQTYLFVQFIKILCHIGSLSHLSLGKKYKYPFGNRKLSFFEFLRSLEYLLKDLFVLLLSYLRKTVLNFWFVLFQPRSFHPGFLFHLTVLFSFLLLFRSILVLLFLSRFLQFLQLRFQQIFKFRMDQLFRYWPHCPLQTAVPNIQQYICSQKQQLQPDG